jgi:hypothetical protein
MSEGNEPPRPTGVPRGAKPGPMMGAPDIVGKLELVPSRGIPPAVSKYLMAFLEGSDVITVRQHPAMLTPATVAAAGGFLGALIVSLSGASRTQDLFVWIIWGCLLLRLVYAVTNWLNQYIVITEKRCLLISGLTARTVASFPVEHLKEMTVQRSMVGRLMGYGAFLIGSDTASQSVIGYVPYPEQFDLEIKLRLYKEDEKRSPG